MIEESGAGQEQGNNTQLREKIRKAIQNPKSENKYFVDRHKSDFDATKSGVVLENATIKETENFFALLREEIFKACCERDVKPALHLLWDLGCGTPKRQNSWDHELAHVREATSQGIDMSKCKIVATFVEDTRKNLGMYMHFMYPLEDVNPEQAVKIALAPDFLSYEDLKSAEDNMSENEDFFDKKPEIKKDLLRLLSFKKLGVKSI